MARRYAPLLCSIWDDPDFRALSERAQRVYILLISQRKLSICGVVPYTPRSWSKGCNKTSVDDIEEGIAELVDTRFVLVDHETDELLVRTLVKHDPPRGPKSVVAMWRGFAAVDSLRLRQSIVDHVPDEVWDEMRAPPPPAALTLRNTPHDGAPEGGSDGVPHASARAVLRPPSSVLPVRDPTKSHTPTKQERDDVRDALASAFGAASTETERSNRGRQVREILAAGGTAADVADRVALHGRRQNDLPPGRRWAMTANALVTHWSELAPSAPGQNGDGDDPDGYFDVHTGAWISGHTVRRNRAR